MSQKSDTETIEVLLGKVSLGRRNGKRISEVNKEYLLYFLFSSSLHFILPLLCFFPLLSHNLTFKFKFQPHCYQLYIANTNYSLVLKQLQWLCFACQVEFEVVDPQCTLYLIIIVSVLSPFVPPHKLYLIPASSHNLHGVNYEMILYSWYVILFIYYFCINLDWSLNSSIHSNFILH